jgi:acetyltransferase-like isoleucine patch superfamily enzyme/coenzyme F420-reducing hydrogenase beta subunit/lipopolysaccharide biosynthesis glycosyltransferase
MNILFSSDNRVSKYIPAVQASLYANHKDVLIRIFLMHSKITPEIIGVIGGFASDNGQEFIEIKTDEAEFEFFKKVDPKRLEVFPVEAYYHFLAPKYLPQDLERICYLDVDIICDANFYDWYCADFEDNYFISSERYRSLNFTSFNSGVFLINLQKLRDDKKDAEFYARKCAEAEKDKLDLMGDQELLGFCFREHKNNGFSAQIKPGLNFRLFWQMKLALGLDKMPDFSIIHYNTTFKAWNYRFDESFLHQYIGQRLSSERNFDYSVITENVIHIFNLFWKYAETAPFYHEILQNALARTDEIRKQIGVQTRKAKYWLMLLANDIKENHGGAELIIPRAAYNEYNFAVTEGTDFTEYRTRYYVKEQWLIFPLRRQLKKSVKLVVKIKCEYQASGKVYLFLAASSLMTQHLPVIGSNDYCGEITVNADGYGFLCLSSNSFTHQGDFIRFHEISGTTDAAGLAAANAPPPEKSNAASHFDVGVLGRYNNDNWGGSLTVLATFASIRELGFSARMLKLKGHNGDSDLLYNKLCEFTSGEVDNPSARAVWNNHFDNFLLCSDWTLSKKWFLPPEIKSFDWVVDGKGIISFSSSFGNANGGYSESELPILANRLKRFTRLSVREQSGVELCKRIGATHAIQMADPVFSQKAEFYINISNITAHKKIEYEYAAIYLLDMKNDAVEIAFKTAAALGLKPLFIIAYKDRAAAENIGNYDYISDERNGVSSWLYYLNNAEFVVTNSLHCVCLSLIFGKRFVAVERAGFSEVRVMDLLNNFGIEKLFIRNAGDIDGAVDMRIDFDKTQAVIKEMYTTTRNFLTDSIKVKYRIDSLPDNQCTGCFACGYACPRKCVTPVRKERGGFIYPEINEKDCVNCGMCAKACPVMSDQKPESADNSVFCGYSLDEEIRYNSTSGGFFSELALSILKNGNAVIFGAAYETPSRVCHIEITDPEDLPKIRRSKYVQSEIRGAYVKIEAHLNAGKTVLFCGTPCQCGAVRQYLDLKKVRGEKLYLVDFICHSVNSPDAYAAYLRDIETKFGRTAKRVWFKNKEKSWNMFSTRIDFNESDEYYIKDRNEDGFYKGFLKYHLFSRPCCSNCHFKGLDRVSDITLADAWGVKIETDSSCGVSAAIVRSPKGRELFESVRAALYVEEKSAEALTSGNVNLHNSVSAGKFSDYFYRRLSQKISFSQIIAEIESGKLADAGLPVQAAGFSIPDGVSVNGAVIRAHPTARITVKPGSKLILNNDRFPGSNAECLIDLREGAEIVVEGNFRIYHSCRIVVHKNAVLTLGNGYANTNVKIICSKSIEIGDAVIAPDCYVIDSDYHTIRGKDGTVQNAPAPVKFGGHVWLGQNVTVLKGVTIGKGSCVGAKSLVTEDIPPNCLAAGNPAKVIKTDINWS